MSRSCKLMLRPKQSRYVSHEIPPRAYTHAHSSVPIVLARHVLYSVRKLRHAYLSFLTHHPNSQSPSYSLHSRGGHDQPGCRSQTRPQDEGKAPRPHRRRRDTNLHCHTRFLRSLFSPEMLTHVLFCDTAEPHFPASCYAARARQQERCSRFPSLAQPT